MENQVKSNADAYYIEGLEKYHRKDYEGAIADFNSALSLDPEHRFALTRKEIAELRLIDWKKM